MAFVTSPTKRDNRGWAFINCNDDDFWSTWLPHSSFSRVMFFFTPTRLGLREYPYKVVQGTSHRRSRGSPFSERVVKYWNRLPASIVTAPSVKIFKKKLERVWTGVFQRLLHWLNTRLPNALTPLPSPAHHPFTVHIHICYPNLCLFVFFRPVVALFLPFKIIIIIKTNVRLVFSFVG